ncbi:concanavalin A-like lectin/glucanase domain-containing protein [Hyaloraphidium curvatum]|nr:concanavalin A-like lectin/glucanase domain-containing protein [Hyaloraphidium curvatum]
MRGAVFAAAAACALASLLPSAADFAYPDVAGAFGPEYDLVFAEEFDAPSLDPARWTADWDCSGWGNNGRACFTTNTSNLYLEDGVLHLRPVYGRLQPDASLCGPGTGRPPCCCEPSNEVPVDATGAMVTTRHKFAFNQGKLRIRAKMATGYYVWPAIWLLRDWPLGGPITDFGEIDIQEGMGKWPAFWSCVVHYPRLNATGGLIDGKRYKNYNHTSNLNGGFFVYGLDWNASHLIWTIDEKVMYQWNYAKYLNEDEMRPFQDGFHINLDTKVGGRMFGPGYGRTKPTYEELGFDADTWTATEIDYVRLYQPVDRHSFIIGPGPAVLNASGSAFVANATCLYGGCVGTNWDEWVEGWTRKMRYQAAKAARLALEEARKLSAAGARKRAGKRSWDEL